MKSRLHPEDDLQIAIVAYLRAVLKPPVWFTHIPAGGGGEARGRRIKRLGYCAGTPDIMILDGGRAIFGEVKAAKGTLTDSQRETIPMIKHARCPVDIWRSIDDVKASLERWGIPTREVKRNMDGIVQELAPIPFTAEQADYLRELRNREIFDPASPLFPDSGPLVRRKGAK